VKPTWILVATAVGILLMFANKTNAATGNFDLSQFNEDFDPANVQRLNRVYQELLTRGLSAQQIQILLSQILLETGLFTQNPNLNNVDNLNNYAGITSHGNFKNPNGMYARYPSVSDFVSDYLNLLDNSYDALSASSVSEFNNDLLYNNPNGSYYARSGASNYLSNLNYYYNLLSSVSI